MGCAKVHSGICAFVYAKRSYFSPPSCRITASHFPCIVNKKIDCELITRKFRVRSDSNSRPIRRDVVKGFEHRVSKFMFCPIELRVDDLLSEEFPQSLDQV